MLAAAQRLVDLQDFRDVFERFDERWNLPGASIHCVFASVEGGEREAHVLAKPVDQKAQVERAAPDVLARIVAIGYAEPRRRRRHQLHEADGAAL